VFIESALQGLELRVAGDGGERLDFTYIDDLVAGVLRTMQCTAARNEIFNLTYGDSRSIQELIEVIREEFPDASVREEPRDQLMPMRGTLCIDKARRLLGYAPAYPIERGFERYIQWYRRLMGERSVDIEMKPRAVVRV
jgi:nucleoside-diphosphate-sugar epimerase